MLYVMRKLLAVRFVSYRMIKSHSRFINAGSELLVRGEVYYPSRLLGDSQRVAGVGEGPN